MNIVDVFGIYVGFISIIFEHKKQNKFHEVINTETPNN